MSNCPECGHHLTDPVPPRPLAVGDVLVGFCGGAFDVDPIGHWTVEAIGKDWVVARDEADHPHLADGPPNRLVRYRPAHRPKG